ncbi:uncharacterized protein LOC5519100 isoform X1 [Nematostella vectensis]|uniref:uncharacterized protein LOC5519100 isoform X1 n=2 Tax=Nematostella vectensis TaxID=45351 RepID=UPI00207773C9|nr:uncharacterized protein LOC5519100 isoform X1 [Nematostella vectensis]
MAAPLKLFTLATSVLLNSITVAGTLNPEYRGKTLVEFSCSQLSSRIWNSAEKKPICILYRNTVIGATKLEKFLLKFIQNLPRESSINDWSFGYLDSTCDSRSHSHHFGMVSSLQCHIGASKPVIYSPQPAQQPSVRSIRRWIGHVEEEFLERIPPIQTRELFEFFAQRDGISVVGIPGLLYHQTLEYTLKEVASKWGSSVKIWMILPWMENEKDVVDTFGLREFPAVLLFDHKVWRESRSPVCKLEGPLHTRATHIQLELTVRHSKAIILNRENFENEVLETDVPQTPIAVTFYSARDPGSLDYLYVLEMTTKKFTTIDSSFRFGLLNLVNNSQVIEKHVDASLVKSIPFTIVFWQESSPMDYSVKQMLLDRAMPVAQDLYNFLINNSIPLSTTLDKPWIDEKDFCEPHLATQCRADDNTTLLSLEGKTLSYGPSPPPLTWNVKLHVKQKRRPRPHTIPYLTDTTWAAVIEHSVQPQKPAYTASTHQAPTFSVTLVVFIREGCGYCDKIITPLEEMSKSLKMVGASMYLMNCTTQPISCNKQGITGYPTITAYRSLSWEASERCFPPNHTSHYIRMDYHGPVMPNHILGWLTGIKHPAVNKTFFHDEMPTDIKSDDVRLVATVYTRSLARRYLPSMLYNRWYPYECYNLLCELLYGAVPCYALYTRDVVDYLSTSKTDEKELIVSKLVMERIDGVRARLFELGYTLESTMNDGSDTRLHQFHHAHRYRIPAGFKCEDSHATCNDIVLQFVIDHKRLPITHITATTLHTRTGGSSDQNDHIFNQELPVLLALAHRTNITREATFFKELTQAAYSLYRDLVVVTLDVDEFSFWAHNFVPKGYHAQHAFGDSSVPPPLYRYPRLCIVRWDDHQHAAFYPPASELERLGTRVQARLDSIDYQQIVHFAQRYLKEPGKYVVRTEMF